MEGAPSESGAPLEEGIPVGGPSHVDEIGEEAPLGGATAPVLPPGPVDIEPSRERLPNWVMLSTYVSLQERIHRLTGMVADRTICAM